THNQAVGGRGSKDDVRGNGQGGGLTNLLGAMTSTSNTAFTDNLALGGPGGAGLGGGLFNDTGSTLTLDGSQATGNHANGSPGIGGGVYNLGTFTFDPATDVSGNHASTSNNDIFP